MTQEEFLLHYGVKGMKWGVRKAARGTARYAKALGGNLALNAAHPILNNRAINANRKNSSSEAQKARKLFIGYKTKEIESINAKVKSQVAAKKREKLKKFLKGWNADIAKERASIAEKYGKGTEKYKSQIEKLNKTDKMIQDSYKKELGKLRKG